MQTFPVELGVLAALMLLAASMWIPFIVGITSEANAPDNFGRPADLNTLRPWVHRAHRAHLNLLEQAIPFAVLVLLVDRLNGFTPLTAWTAMICLGVRVIHAAGMISGVTRFPARPIIFSAGWVCCLIMAYSVFAAV